ncbi:ketosteroid isomerase-like protein [Rhizobium sp. SG_E_25_P2]|uniref:nuclear transport factor 2 family protein n=1 Tax=Rhizobium sp. SG_E_25_P2 TaxID=2879942 RepID=UPI002473C3B5|nr:nuclear transport factor 2 family protein [Rhizobium sp. SG_E_25_P2]MDH6265411.1 ketosteroid isomerase-like protein [Rhizobium sp. SG_E_25_P2]
MNLPPILAAYFEADRRNDADALVETFTDTAIVDDERVRREGKEEIRRWWREAKQASQFVAEPLDLRDADGVFHVAAKVSGQFPGSPVMLTHSFTVEAGKIAMLEIR